MKILIIGGTIFLGRHLVEVTLERGHEITNHPPDKKLRVGIEPKREKELLKILPSQN